MARSLLAILVFSVALSIRGTAAAATPAAAAEPQPRCILVELYVSGSEAAEAVESMRSTLQTRKGVRLREFDVNAEVSAARRWEQIRKRFRLNDAALPAVYCAGDLVVHQRDDQAFQRKLDSLFGLTVFVRTGCPHCADAKGFLQTIGRQYPGLRFVIRDLATDKTAAADLQALVQRYQKSATSVPVFHVFNQLIVGYDHAGVAAQRLETLLRQWTVPCDTSPRTTGRQPGEPDAAARKPPLHEPPETAGIGAASSSTDCIQSDTWHDGWTPFAPLAGTCVSLDLVAAIAADDPESAGGDPEADEEATEPDLLPLPGGPTDAAEIDPSEPGSVDAATASDPTEAVDVPVLGRLSVRSLGLPLFTLAIGLVDGFNPCAMWVLLFLLSILVSLRDRTRILAVAGTFVVISGLAYFAFMAAWLTVFQFIGLLRPAQVVLGLVAMLIGAIHIKDFFAFKKGISLSIPDSAKPGIYARVRRIVTAENLTGAVIGAITLAVLINVIELLCTAGLPALYTEILALQNLPAWKEYSYLALYNLAYMADDALMVTLVVVTLGRRKLQENEGRWLKLLSGAVIFVLGIVMVLRPDMLA